MKAIAAASAIFTIAIPGVGSTTITLTPVAPCTLTSQSGSSYSLNCPLAVAGSSGGIALSTWTGAASGTTFATGGTAPNYTLNAGSGGIPAGWTGGATATASP